MSCSLLELMAQIIGHHNSYIEEEGMRIVRGKLIGSLDLFNRRFVVAKVTLGQTGKTPGQGQVWVQGECLSVQC
jgi:hypothetical protein